MLPANRMTRCQAAGTRPAVLQLEASLNGEAHKQTVVPFGFQAAVAICWIVLTVALIGGDALLLDRHLIHQVSTSFRIHVPNEE